MTEPISTHPTPSAVPWTPDMMAPQMASPAPMANAPTPQPHMQPAQYHAPQPEYAQPPVPQYQPQHPIAPQPYSQVPQAPQPQMVPPQIQPTQYAPQMQQPAPPQMAQNPQYAPQQHQQPQHQQTYVQPGPPPPLRPHMPSDASTLPPIEPEKSKSFIANLLKRSPKPQQVEQEAQAPAASGSLFNKNFALGAVTGLVIGAFVLPMLLNMVGGNAPAQTQAQLGTSSIAEVSPAATEGDTFLDNAMATDVP